MTDPEDTEDSNANQEPEGNGPENEIPEDTSTPVENDTTPAFKSCTCGETSHKATCEAGLSGPTAGRCSACGVTGGHTADCSKNPAVPEEPKDPEPERPADTCEECGGTDGKHTETCSKNPNKPSVNPAHPNGAKCIFCGYTGWHKDGCAYNADSGLCPECYSKGSHLRTCSQHPDNQKKLPPEKGSFDLSSRSRPRARSGPGSHPGDTHSRHSGAHGPRHAGCAQRP